MKALKTIFIKAPCKIHRLIHHKLEFLYYRFFYSSSNLTIDLKPGRYLLFGGESLENTADIYKNTFINRIEKKIKEADSISDHIFDLLGSGAKELSPKGEGYQYIDWHCDFKNGYSWDPRTFYRKIRFGHLEGVDIKVPWELSRFQHLHVLGQAYVLTDNKKYSDEFADQIIDWIKHNPYCFGVNWKCAMDVAIRAVNWLVVMEYFSEKDLFSKDFLKLFYASIYEHGKYIWRHLDFTSKWKTNHYLSDIAGLFFISVYCPFFEESTEWQKFSLRELHKEMEKQVYPDGCSFESSTSYHRLVLEIFFYSLLLGQRAGMSFTENYISKVRKMFELSLNCIKPDGCIPQIGDNDSGRFLKFSNRPVLEHKYLLSLATSYFNNSSFKLEPFELDEEAFWIFGESGNTSWNNLPFREDLLRPKSFQDAGWFIIRHENDYCFIPCGPNGGDGWHAHNDKLSFELMLNGKNIIVDPGTYVYTSHLDERNKFRSTEYHNTVKFEGYEQNEIPYGYFLLPDRVEIISAELIETDNENVFKGEIRYVDIVHKRTISLDKRNNSCQITDDLSCSNSVKAKLLFHLSPYLTVEGNNILEKATGKKIASLNVDGYKLEKGEYDYSQEYGVKSKAEYLFVNMFVTKENMSVNTYIN